MLNFKFPLNISLFTQFLNLVNDSSAYSTELDFTSFHLSAFAVSTQVIEIFQSLNVLLYAKIHVPLIPDFCCIQIFVLLSQSLKKSNLSSQEGGVECYSKYMKQNCFTYFLHIQ